MVDHGVTLATSGSADARGIPAMDEIDRQLVDALRADARASYAQLARLVGLSAPSVQERVRRLERRAIITGYHASVDLAAAGLGVTALVGLHQTESAELAAVADRLSAVTEVEDCFFVAGDNAFVVKVRVPDVAALETTIWRLQSVEGVALTRTTVVLSTKWEHRPVPLPPGAPARSTTRLVVRPIGHEPQ
jgi:Lrp/AsnC family leucine-responsive transcriptional regulator